MASEKMGGTMVENKEQIKKFIFEALNEIDLEDSARKIDVSNDTVLYGEEGLMESIQLVNFIVAVEQKIEDTLGKTVSIADEKAISQKNSPFRTVETLCDYVISLIK